MAFIQKIEEGAKAPITFKMYDDDYDYNDFARRADINFEDHLHTLKYGLEDQELFREAYSYLMKGIKNGTITFDDGTYHDSTGGRYNYYGAPVDKNGNIKKDRNKDYYGLMASYIYKQQLMAKKYEKPEDNTKIKWDGQNTASSQLYKYLFNSDTADIASFKGLLTKDKKGNIDKSKQVAALLEALKKYRKSIEDTNNSMYTEFTDVDRASQRGYLDQIDKALADGKLDDSDYYALSQIFGATTTNNIREMFGDAPTTETSSETTTLPARETTTLSTDETTSTTAKDFDTWFNLNYGNPQNSLVLSIDTSDIGKPLATYSSTYLVKSLLGLDTKKLISTLLNLFYNNSYNFNAEDYIRRGFNGNNGPYNKNSVIQSIFARLTGLGLTSIATQDGFHYIAGTINRSRKTCLLYNPNTYILKEVYVKDVPSLVNAFKNSWNKKKVTTNKDGGVLKYKKGDKVGFTDITSLDKIPTYEGIGSYYLGTDDIDNTEFLNNYFNLFNDASGNFDYNRYINTIIKNVDERSLYGLNTFNNLGTEDNISSNYKTFGTNFNVYAKGLNELLFGDKETYRTNGGHANKFYKFSGKASSDVPGTWTDKYKGLQMFSRIMAPTDSTLSDGQFGNWGKILAAKGYDEAVYYVGSDGKGLWIPIKSTDPQDPRLDYSTKKKLVAGINPDLLKPELATDKVSVPEPADLKKKLTHIDPTSGDLPPIEEPKVNTILSRIPDLLATGRAALSVIANNKIYKNAVKAAERPLFNPDLRQRPVHGDKQTRDLAFNLGVQGMRLVRNSFGADQARNDLLSRQSYLDNVQSQDKGNLVDTTMKRETLKEAIAAAEYSSKNRVDIANKNIQQIFEENKDKMLAESLKINANWKTADNLFTGFEERDRIKLKEQKESQISQLSDIINDEYTRVTEPATQWYKAKLAEASAKGIVLTETNTPELKNYYAFMRKAAAMRKARINKVISEVNGYKYNGIDYTPEQIQKFTWDPAKNYYSTQTLWSKLGGKLILRKFKL